MPLPPPGRVHKQVRDMSLVGDQHRPGEPHHTFLVCCQVNPVLCRQFVPEHTLGPRGGGICCLQRHDGLEVVDGEGSDDHRLQVPAHGPS